MKKRALVLVLVIALCVGTASAQFGESSTTRPITKMQSSAISNSNSSSFN